MLVSTYGIPLDITISRLYREGYIIDWSDFYLSALREGWKERTTLEKIKKTVREVSGVPESETVVNRLKELFGS